MTDRLTITRPDDWHLHLRDGAMLDAVTRDTAMHFGRALIMPNLVPPVVTGSDAAAYRARIMAACPDGAAAPKRPRYCSRRDAGSSKIRLDGVR